MFELLSLEKTMHFKDKPSLTYANALTNLAEQIGLKGTLNLLALEQEIKNAIVTKAISLTNNTTVDPSVDAIIGTFHRWALAIHNDDLIPAPGNAYPNNIVYDMIKELRKNANLSPEDSLLLFFMDGLNARKISKGENPSLDFISTASILQQIQVLSDMGYSCDVFKKFQDKYNSIKSYIKLQTEIENKMTTLKTGTLFSFLSAKPYDIFNFQKEYNHIMGANSYNLKIACTKGVQALALYNKERLSEDLEKMVMAIEEVLKFVSSYQQIKATPEAQSLTLWDASEWVCRAIVALEIAASHHVTYQDKFQQWIKDPIIKDICERSAQGNFPGKARNIDIADLPILELFMQERYTAKKKEKAIIY